jgi:hypothetical protein
VLNASGYENEELHEGFGSSARKHVGIKRKEKKLLQRLFATPTTLQSGTT